MNELSILGQRTEGAKGFSSQEGCCHLGIARVFQEQKHPLTLSALTGSLAQISSGRQHEFWGLRDAWLRTLAKDQPTARPKSLSVANRNPTAKDDKNF